MQNHQNCTICIACPSPGRCLELAKRDEHKARLKKVSYKEEERVT